MGSEFSLKEMLSDMYEYLIPLLKYFEGDYHATKGNYV